MDFKPTLRLAKRLVESFFASEEDELDAMRPRFLDQDEPKDLGKREAFQKPSEKPQAAKKGKTKADGTPWYMDGQDLDGWEDTNANDEKKAEAAESRARHED